MYLTGANTYSGGTTLNAPLVLSGAGTLGASSGSTTINLGGALDLGGTNQVQNGGLTLKRGWIGNGTFTSSGSFAIESGTVDATLAGTGALTKSTSDVAMLSRANSYSGGTTISAGTLQIGNGGTSGSISGTVTNNGSLIFNRLDDFSFGGTISGSGSLTKTGAGMLTLAGASTYAGGTTINAGTLAVGNAQALGTAGVTLNGGKLRSIGDLTLTNSMTYAASQTSTVAAAAGRPLTLSGRQTIQAGSALVFGSASETGTVVWSSFSNFAPSAFSLEVAGGTLKDGGGVLGGLTGLASSTTVSTGATLDLTAGGGSIKNLQGAGMVATGGLLVVDSGDFGGSITGAGTLNKFTTGKLVLSGVNSHAGGTLISGGELRVDGSLGSGAVTVARLGTLSGTGTIAGPVTVGGTLSAGHSPGTLTVGSLVLNSGATSVFELNRPGGIGGSDPVTGNDLIKVTGDLTLGGRLDARVAAAGYYRLFDYGGTLAGSFASQSATSTRAGLTVASAGVETGVAGQVNLAVLGVGQTMQFWDGANTTASGGVNGGAGTWTSFGTNWTTSTGSANMGWGGSVGVFAGSAGGTVAVSGAQRFDTLQFSANGYELSGGTLGIAPASGTFGTFNVDAGVSASIASTIADGGGTSIEKVGGGTLTLTGFNTYSGGTKISQGTLAIEGIQPLGTGTVTLNGGTLRMADCGCGSAALSNAFAIGAAGGTLDAGEGVLEIGGNIRGGGALTITGAGGPLGGYAAFSGDNRYGGPTRITADGILLALSPTALSPNSDYAVDGILDSGGFDATLRSLSGAASGRIGSSSSAPVTLTVAGGGTFEGVILNGGTGPVSLVKNGTGTLTLNGRNTYTGATTVAAGTLVVGGAGHAGASLASTVTVNAGGTLGGIGTVGGLIAASGGTLAPGNSIGTLNVAGNVSFAAGSAYRVEIDPAGASDRIAASGTATLTGGTVMVEKAPGSYVPGTRYTILTAAGGVSGTFAGLTQNLPFIALGLSYDPGNVYLDIARNQVSFASVGLTRNQIATGTAVEGLGQGNTLYDAVAQQASPGAARQAFDALSGEIHASAKSALVEESWLLRGAMNDRLRSASGSVGAAPMATLNYGFSADLAPGVTGPIPTLRSDRFAVWGQGYGAWGRSDADGNAAKLTRSTGGFLIGVDAAVFDTLRFGLLAGYGRSRFDVNGRLSSGESDNYHLGLYGGGEWGALSLRTGLSYTWHDLSTRRSVVSAGLGDTLRADYDAGTAQAFGELGYRIDLGQTALGQIALEPFAGLAYVVLHSDRFTERGAAAALSGNNDETSLGYATLGLRAATTTRLLGMDLTLRGGLGWRHTFGNVDPKTTLAFAGSNPFAIAGLPIARDAALVEARLDLGLATGVTLGASYAGQLAQDAQDHAFKGVLAVRF
ncbi:outer membrane autotransporter barrel domain-containing protein [Bosea thiooxidans]|uniref:Outer membrane autotransporter barrel domain-containing protein n=2 Tax=Bosea thiooxidans TaxID=53254 RepID=A0A1T5FZ40_9HYPH|nr:outer membrane autotransporter barrel domain-containing protein [Bosea thiooxidans]